jgi:hypothetical protein
MPLEMALPRHEVVPARNNEADMVEPRARLDEAFSPVRIVAMENEGELVAFARQYHSGPAGVGYLPAEREAEHPLVPAHARVEVCNGESYVMQLRTRLHSRPASVDGWFHSEVLKLSGV